MTCLWSHSCSFHSRARTRTISQPQLPRTPLHKAPIPVYFTLIVGLLFLSPSIHVSIHPSSCLPTVWFLSVMSMNTWLQCARRCVRPRACATTKAILLIYKSNGTQWEMLCAAEARDIAPGLYGGGMYPCVIFGVECFYNNYTNASGWERARSAGDLLGWKNAMVRDEAGEVSGNGLKRAF